MATRLAAVRRAGARPPAHRDVLDMAAGGAPDALDEVHPLPARALPRKRRDDDLVGRVVLQRVSTLVSGSASIDLARRPRGRPGAAPGCVRSSRSCAVAAASGLLPPCGEMIVKRCGDSVGASSTEPRSTALAHGLVGDHQRVLDLLRLEVDDHVLDRERGSLLDALDQVAAQEARTRIGVASR